MCWMGCKPFSVGTGANRGLCEWKGLAYAVNGTTLQQVASNGSQSALGTIAGGARCVFAGDASFLYIVTGGRVYRTDGATVESVSDSDFGIA